MHDDIDFTQRTSFSVWDYDKAIETLSASVNPIKSREANRRKALSIKDLLIKVCNFTSHLQNVLTKLQPIQRITRYELLFKDLCRLTPSCDDPTSHAVLDDVLYRLGETCRNVDESRDNPDKLRLMENSWILQDRLCFSDKVSISSHGKFVLLILSASTRAFVPAPWPFISLRYIVCCLPKQDEVPWMLHDLCLIRVMSSTRSGRSKFLKVQGRRRHFLGVNEHRGER